MENTMLINSLPAVVDDSKIIIFSPYKKLIVSFPAEKDMEEIKSELIGLDMEGKPGSLSLVDDSVGKIIICTTYRCNLRCKYCFVNAGCKKAPELPFVIVEKAINKIMKTGISRLKIHFFGGEPTLNFGAIKKTVEFTKKLGNLAVDFEITTNGMVSEKKLKYMIDNNFIFSVSLDGTSDIHNFHRPTTGGGNSFDTVMRTINRLVKNGSPFRVRSTVTSVSVSHMPKIVRHFANIGIPIVHFEAFVPFGRGEEIIHLKPDPETYAAKFIQSIDVAEQMGIKVTEFTLFQLFNPLIQKCFSMYRRRFVLMPDGNITFCLGAQSNRSDLENAFYIGRYDPEMNDVVLAEDKIDLLRKKFPVDAIKRCRNCFAKYICCGICPAHNIIINNDPTIIDDFGCIVRKRLIKDAIIRIWKQSERSL